jgi:hypothetical protein
MNQTNAKDLSLSAAEARQLQADIFDLLIKINGLIEIKQQAAAEPTVQVELRGSGF